MDSLAKIARRRWTMPSKKSKKWSQKITDNSDAMDLEKDVFKQRSAKKIADSLKHSAEDSNRRKASPFQSAMSMLNFYINRAGTQLSKSRRARLEKAKDELRKDFGRKP
jgi:predicted KAP-like P-loop ATPase